MKGEPQSLEKLESLAINLRKNLSAFDTHSHKFGMAYKTSEGRIFYVDNFSHSMGFCGFYLGKDFSERDNFPRARKLYRAPEYDLKPANARLEINIDAIKNRIAKLMEDCGYPNSISHYSAFMQFANEWSQGIFTDGVIIQSPPNMEILEAAKTSLKNAISGKDNDPIAAMENALDAINEFITARKP